MRTFSWGFVVFVEEDFATDMLIETTLNEHDRSVINITRKLKELQSSAMLRKETNKLPF